MSKPLRPFRRAVLRGLAILMPPLLTIVLFIWAWSVIETYILKPSESVAGAVISWTYREHLDEAPRDDAGAPLYTDPVAENGKLVGFRYRSREYERDGNEDGWIGYYSDDYVKREYLNRSQVLPFFIALFLLVLYLLGKFVAAGIGRMIVGSFDALIQRLPVVSNVYSSVKQVTDFVLTEREIEFNRVVAVEYPRRGIWSVGFVTGESMLDIRSAAKEPVLSVLMPTSPMPMTGFTVTVLKSDAVDLDLTVDQAIQFIISCGVVIPLQQQGTKAVELQQNIAQPVPQPPGPHGRDEVTPGAESSQGTVGEPGV